MDFLAELLVAALIFIGGFFAFVGSYGLVKLPDTMSRLHTPTKTTTLGVGAILHRPHVVRQGFPLGLSGLLMFLKALLNRLADCLGLHCPCERRLSLL